ncbi:MAG TPA: response regulator [Thermoanaerobaculia bacterium]|nr:response regulator [Thermoanaerobaculia bacterium]
MPVEPYRRVLVVDDDHEVRELLATVLMQKSLVVDRAADGRHAVELLRENEYAVVLLDLMMPDLDGFTVLDVMSAEGRVPPIVLVITGAEREVVEQLDAQRIHGIIRKPFDPHDLAAIVHACSEVRARNVFETMAIATMISSAPLLAWLSWRA